MTSTDTSEHRQTALIVGASRGLGQAIAAELFGRGWDVIGTVREPMPRDRALLVVALLTLTVYQE